MPPMFDPRREEALRQALGRTPEQWAPVAHRAREVFDGLPIAGKRVLDVGAGIGTYALYLRRVGGAREVVALEPSAGVGGHADIGERLRQRVAAATGPDAPGGPGGVEIVEQTFQAYAPAAPFDVIVLLNSINHLHETRAPLDLDPVAHTAFEAVFAKLRDWLVPGGTLLINELDRRCLERYTSRIGVPRLFTRRIDYDLHQAPATWADLARGAGFTDVRWRGVTPRRLRRLGRLGRHPVVGFATNAMFVLRATRR